MNTYPCVPGGILRLAYLKAVPWQKAEKYIVYAQHLRACPTCRAMLEGLHNLASRQTDTPEFRDEIDKEMRR